MHEPRAVTDLPRPLSALERLFWLADQHRPNRFCAVAEVEGERPLEAWSEAFRAVVERAPLAGCSIAADGDGQPWFHPGPPPRLEAVAGRRPEEWPDFVAERLAEPPSGGAGPVLRAALLHAPGRAALVLTAHHAAADGLGCARLLRDVLRAAGGEEAARGRDGGAATESRVRARHGDCDPAELGEPPPPVPLRPLPPAGEAAPPRIARAALTAGETEALRRRARAEGTTVHTALALALAGALRRARPGGQATRLVSPIDLRRRLLGGGEHFGLCVLAALSFLRTEDLGGGDARAFWAAARRFGEGLAPFLDPGFLRANLRAIEGLGPSIATPEAAAELFASVYGCELLVTNLGATDLPAGFGDLALSGFWGPVVTLGFAGEQAVGVATAGGCLRLALASFDPAPGLLEEAVGALRSRL